MTTFDENVEKKRAIEKQKKSVPKFEKIHGILFLSEHQKNIISFSTGKMKWKSFGNYPSNLINSHFVTSSVNDCVHNKSEKKKEEISFKKYGYWDEHLFIHELAIQEESIEFNLNNIDKKTENQVIIIDDDFFFVAKTGSENYKVYKIYKNSIIYIPTKKIVVKKREKKLGGNLDQKKVTTRKKVPKPKKKKKMEKVGEIESIPAKRKQNKISSIDNDEVTGDGPERKKRKIINNLPKFLF